MKITEKQTGKVVRTVSDIFRAGAIVDAMNESAGWARTGKSYELQP